GGGPSPVLLAGDHAGVMVGALLFRGPPDGTIFTPMLGRDAGTIGCVGVAAAARGARRGGATGARAAGRVRGAGGGRSVVAGAWEWRGAGGPAPCHIGWTEREWFYRRGATSRGGATTWPS